MSSKEALADYSTNEFCNYLSSYVEDEVIHTHRIRGIDFVNLKDNELKELFPVMGTSRKESQSPGSVERN